MSQFKDVLKRLQDVAKNLGTYWKKSPTTKIVLINTGVYVLHSSFRSCGR